MPAAQALTVVAETKKAVAVLKGNSQVEGVVTLLQEDNGIPFDLFSPLFAFNFLVICYSFAPVLLQGFWFCKH